MMFCPECKSMLESYDGKLRCPKCGYEKELDSSDKSHLQKVNHIQEKDIIIVDGDKEKNVTLPTIEIKCPECGYELAEWWLRQLRSADESEVRFFRCVKCGKTWREYD